MSEPADPIYLDYNATTPVDSEVREAMQPFLDRQFGNPSSGHDYGRPARTALQRAREQIARLLGAHASEIVLTGSGSEATNLALKGLVFAALQRSRPEELHIVTSTIEHPATLEASQFLQRLGCRLTIVPVDREGVLDLPALRRALRHGALVVSVMHANNEVGTIQPIAEIAALAHEHGALVHADAAQSAGKIAVDVDELGVDLLTLAGHKLYAPKGVGALYVRDGVTLEPLVHGGGQEAGLRSGTENVAYAVALGTACEIARWSQQQDAQRLGGLTARLWQRLHSALGERIVLNGHSQQRLPNTLNVSFLDHHGPQLLARAPGVAASTGSACHDDESTSPVLAAMGLRGARAAGAIRLSVGRCTTGADVDRAAALLVSAASASTADGDADAASDASRAPEPEHRGPVARRRAASLDARSLFDAGSR